MRLSNLKNELTEDLYKTCIEDINLLMIELKGESIFTYAILGNSGFDSIGSAACSRKGVENSVKELVKIGTDKEKAYLEVKAFSDAWDCINNNAQLFRDINKQFEKIQDAFYDGELEDISDYMDDLDNFYFEVVMEVLQKLRRNNCFSVLPFEPNLFLGLQFSDPTRGAKKFMAKAAQELNSPERYQEIISCYNS